MKKATIYYNSEPITTVIIDSFTSEIAEDAYFLMRENKTVAIIPFNYLIIFEDNEKNI
jgi:hypothetical protein